MSERTEIGPSGHPWFLELSQALGVQFEQPYRLAMTQLLNKKDPQAIADMFGPFTPKLFNGILTDAQIEQITACPSSQSLSSEQATNNFIKLTQGVARVYAQQTGREAPADEMYLKLADQVRMQIPTETKTELVVNKVADEPQISEDRRKQLKEANGAYVGVTDAVLQSEHLEIEDRDGIKGVTIQAGGEDHFVQLEHLWTFIDNSPVASNGIRKDQFIQEYRQKKITQEARQKLTAADNEEKQQALKNEWMDFILAIRRDQLRQEVDDLTKIQPRLAKERQELKNLTLEELRDGMIEFYPQSPLADQAEITEIETAFQIASEKLQLHQVIDKILGSEHYDDMVVGIDNAQQRIEHQIIENLRPEATPIDPEKSESIPVFAELEPVVREYHQAICRTLYQEVLIAHYPTSSEELSRIKTIYQKTLYTLFIGLKSPPIDLSAEQYSQKPELEKVSLIFGQLMRKILSGINDYQDIEPLVAEIVNSQLQLAKDNRQLAVRAHDGRKISGDLTREIECRQLLNQKLVDDLLPAVVYSQAVGEAMDEESLIHSAEVWQSHWRDELKLPTASVRGIDTDVPYSPKFRTIQHVRQEITAIKNQSRQDLPAIKENREKRLQVDEARNRIKQSRQSIGQALTQLEEFKAQAQERFNTAQMAHDQAQQKQQETPTKRGLLGRITNSQKLEMVNQEYLQAQVTLKDAQDNRQRIFEGQGVASGITEQILAARTIIQKTQDQIGRLGFSPTPSEKIDFEPQVDEQGRPIIQILNPEDK